jgi:class 3 adenylate cyclase
VTASALSPLVPAALAEHLTAQGTALPSVDRRSAAVVFADISGFTALSERLAARGTAAGAEELSRLLNACFGHAVDVIARHGGDILRFAGDAPIAVFPPDDDSHGLDGAVARAASCALALQDAMADLRRTDAVDLAIRVGVGAGAAVSMVVGGVDGRREFVLGGECLQSAVNALELADPGQVVLAAAAARWLSSDSCAHEALAGGAWRIRTAPPLPTVFTTAALHQNDLDPAAIRPFISRAVLARIDAGQSDWVAELRRVTTLFIAIHGVELSVADDCGRIHTAFEAIQRAVYEAAGSINQFLVDDKGVVVVAAWGVPGRTHEDDAGRAASAALHVAARLQSIGVGCGLATGRVFCGWRGNQRRREFALIGSIVSVAARLAACADGILCDRATRDLAARRLEFESAGDVQLKGLRAPLAVYRPLASSRLGAFTHRDARAADGGGQLVGRAAERARIDSALDELRRGQGATIVIEGEAGVGKSSLITCAIERAVAQGITVLTGAGNSVAASEPYLAMRTPVEALLKLPPHGAAPDRLAAFERAVASRPQVGERAPLVASVAGVAVPDTPLTARMTESLRFENTRDVIVRLLQQEAGRTPTLLVIDDGHWLDSASWGIVLAAHRRIANLLVLVGARPFAENPPLELQAIRRSRRTHSWRLDRLDDAETIELACRMLQVDVLPSPVVRLLQSKTAGHPLFVAELTRSLRDGGFLTVEGRVARLTRDAHDLDQHAFPETVHDVVAGRLDRLTPAQQLTVKVASVAGADFSSRVVADAHPIERDESTLRDDLAALVREGILVPEDDRGDRYAFRHSVIQDVAYGLLLSEQRRALHRSIAEWHERDGANQPLQSLLAHHWMQAGDVPRALDAMERAGARVAADGAARETIRFFQQALSLADASGFPVAPLRRARWLRELGQAHLLNSTPDRAREALNAAVALVGRPWPRSRVGFVGRLARELARQSLHLVHPPRPVSDDNGRGVLEVDALNSIANQAYFNQDQLEQLTSILAGINVAERTGNTAAMCRSYASGGYIVSLFGFERLARRWWDRAAQAREPGAISHAFLSQAMHAVDTTRWDDAERLALRALEVAIEAGAHLDAVNALFALMFALSNRGDLEATLERAREALAAAQAAHLEHRQVWCHHSIATSLIAMEQNADAWVHTRQAIDLMADVTDPLTIATHMAHRVEFALVAGDLVEAGDFATRLLAHVTRNPPAMMGTFNVFFHLVEFFLVKWQDGLRAGGDVGLARDSARTVHRRLRQYARLFPIARPAEARIGALILGLEGAERRKARSLRRSLALASEYRMPIEEGLAHQELGALANVPPAERARHLNRARELFASHGQLRRQHRVESMMAATGDAVGVA